MGFLEKLKAIGLYFPKLKSISLIKLSVRVDKSIHVEGGSTVVVNPQKLTGKQRRGLAKVLAEDGLDEAGAILEETSTPLIEEAIQALPAIRDTSKQFLAFIPPGDVPLLKACLFLKRRFENGEPVDDLKGQIMQVYGTRGGNFANLCSAGYLESWFLPLHQELQKLFPNDPAAAQAKFLSVYNTIVNELPWTEFISSGSGRAKIQGRILAKIQRNVKLGIRHFNIHGLGEANVRTIMNLLPEIQSATNAIAVKVDRQATRVFVRLEIP